MPGDAFGQEEVTTARRIADRVSRAAALAIKRGKSVDFTGYWQRHIVDYGPIPSRDRARLFCLVPPALAMRPSFPWPCWIRAKSSKRFLGLFE
jgi:hypothetical protein